MRETQQKTSKSEVFNNQDLTNCIYKVKSKMELDNKFILDCTCSARSIWFVKNHPNAIFTDIRKEPKGFDPHRPNTEVCPDMQMDYRDLKFPSNFFALVVWDPPHLKNLGAKSWFAKRYGSLNSETWQNDIYQGYKNIMRVLRPLGILIMKWSCAKDIIRSRHVSLKEMLNVIPDEPLFGHTTGSNSQTNWMCFMKMPDKVNE
jgi:hypothetical protein